MCSRRQPARPRRPTLHPPSYPCNRSCKTSRSTRSITSAVRSDAFSGVTRAGCRFPHLFSSFRTPPSVSSKRPVRMETLWPLISTTDHRPSVDPAFFWVLGSDRTVRPLGPYPPAAVESRSCPPWLQTCRLDQSRLALPFGPSSGPEPKGSSQSLQSVIDFTANSPGLKSRSTAWIPRTQRRWKLAHHLL